MNSKERFSDRVDSYVKYRPSYPVAAIDYLYDVIGVERESTIADIGAGTGIFAELLVERGNTVIGVEPNTEMREVAVATLAEEPNFKVSAGSAEETGLPDHSVDYITCAQAFHWFDQQATQTEFKRILRAEGKVILIWNSRLTTGTPFLEQYEQLLRDYGTDYTKVNHKNVSPEKLQPFFKKDTMELAKFGNRQVFDWEGLAGRLHSSSYVPTSDHPKYNDMIEQLKLIFEQNQQEGVVFFDYETEVFWGEV